MQPTSCARGCQLGLRAKRLLRPNQIEQWKQECWQEAYRRQDPQQLACASLPAKQQKRLPIRKLHQSEVKAFGLTTFSDSLVQMVPIGLRALLPP